MGHINKNPGEGDPTASAFIVRTDREEPRILLHKHRKLDLWMQFGGHIEPSRKETPWQAVIREIREEAGYEISQLNVLQPSLRVGPLENTDNHPMPFNINSHPIDTGDGCVDHFHSDIEWAFTATEDPKNPPQDGESEDIRRFTSTELDRLSDEEIPPDVRTICQYVLNKLVGELEEISIPSTG